MKKRLLCALLCAVMTVGLCMPAYAESLDSELTRVTLAVKKTLSVADTYTEFSGNVEDLGALRIWSLNWSDEEGNSLYVLADGAGKVFSYSTGDPAVPVSTASGYAPTLSKVTSGQALKTAQAFLAAVLTAGESAQLKAEGSAGTLNADYSFDAPILRSGVPTQNTVQLLVDRTSGKVTSYQRTDIYKAYINDLPSAKPNVSSDKAAAAFAGALKLELQYTASDDGKTAVLRYIPVSDGGEWYVDAQTGKLTNLADAWGKLRIQGGAANESAATAADTSLPSLTEAEQAAVEKLQGVQSKESLDAAVRKIAALGLSRYTLASASYSENKDAGTVECVLRYTRPLSAGEIDTSSGTVPSNLQQTRMLTVDARTAALLEGWTYRPWYAKDVSADRAKLQPAAESFLKSNYAGYAASVALTDGEGEVFQYDRKVNGYFYHDDYVNISVDPLDGSIAGFFSSWSDQLTFASAEGLVSEEKARAAYCAAYQAQLNYLDEPVSVDTSIPIWKTYADCCGTTAYRYVLGYTWVCSGESVLGVDAKTGALVRSPAAAQTQSYQDLSGSFAKKQIEALAEAGVRFGASDRFRPLEKLTEQAMLVLLLNSCGYNYDESALDGDTQEQLYQNAWNEGFLAQGSRSPDRTVTRLELVKAILSASPYGPAAKLSGIFVASFRDAASIPAADLGYVAIAEGLGLVRGDSAHRFDPSRTMTRQAAAAVLYAYMSR